MTQREIRKLLAAKDDDRFDAVRAWRDSRRMPRYAVVVDGDHELLVDFDNILSIDTFLAVVKQRSQALLSEFFPAPEELCAHGPEGSFVHELVIPFCSRPQPATETETGRPPTQWPTEPLRETGASQRQTTVRRTFPPGSEWLYAKLYTGTSTADEVLSTVVAPVVRQALLSGAADRWFFIRYGDPDWHLRLRFHGDPGELHDQVLPLLQDAVAPQLDDGRIWRFQLDTYQRELGRYGGPAGIGLCERLFQADSEAVLHIVDNYGDDLGAAARWQLAVRGIDRLLADLDLENDDKLDLLSSLRDSFAREFNTGKGFRKQLAKRLRGERQGLEEALEPFYDTGHPLAAGFRALDVRSQQLPPIAAELRQAERRGRLAGTVAHLAPSLLHMFVNRLLRSDGRAHELVLYDFLYQLLRSRAARDRAARDRAARDRASRNASTQPPADVVRAGLTGRRAG